MRINESEDAPKENFTALVSIEILKKIKEGFESNEDFENIPAPVISQKYNVFIKGIERLNDKERYIYLLTTFGNLSAGIISENMGINLSQTLDMISVLSSKVQDIPELKEMEVRKSVYLSTQFRSPSGIPFLDIKVPQFLITTLEHDYQLIMQNQEKSMITTVRKETENMKSNAVKSNQKPSVKKAGFKHKKLIIVGIMLLIFVGAGAIILPRVLNSTADATRVTTYNVDEITYGNVSTTVSGSGTLTPVISETLTSTYSGEVETVNYTVGDEVAANDVIAVIASDNGDEEIVAPCDGVLVELPISVGDEVAQGGSVAMVMGKDGFTMGIAVDELNISSIALDQEVSFTIDAVDGDYTGSVTEISYNGSTSNGSTAFQITATVEYIEGVYPGMSASAEIVIEDSGDGLIVPVDAVETSGDDNYVYLAPSDAELGTSYEEDEINLEDLTTVTVETGMSDGSYIMIESDELEEGDLIVITQITSTLTGSEEEGEEGEMGGFPGGGDMDFGDFDFEDFDPSQMPEGGGSFPGMSE